MTSSPRHRTTGSPTTFRLMVSTGGHILPRPHDKSLRYVGGETRMLTVDRHSTLSDLTSRLSKTVITRSSSTSPVQFTLKYQLPMEDLDSLVSVTNDEDLENMIDECERLSSGSCPGSGSASRIRLFIFPKPNQNCSVSVSETGLSLFLENKDNPSKSEDWFLNALNGTSSGFSDTSSVKCLLDLDDQILLPERKDGRVDNSGQDVRSIPDSPMLETTSSFGSGSSQANLPPVEDCLKILASPAAPVVVSGSPVSSWTVIQEQEQSDPFLSYQEKTDQGLQVDYLKHNQQQSTGLDLGSIDSILSDLTLTNQSSPVSQIQSSNHNNQVVDPDHDQNTGIQMLQQQQNPHNSSYLMPIPTTQPQFIPQPQYIHPHHHPSVAVPITSYYQHHPHHPPPDQQTFMYYIPATHPPQGYNFQSQQPQPSQADTRSAAPTKTDLPPGVYRTNSGGPQLVRIPSGYQNQPQHVGYSGMHQPTQPMYYATTLSTGQQVRTGQP